MNLELSNQEAQELVALIDLAVKASGIRVAEVAVKLCKKIEEASGPVESTTQIE